MSPCRIEISLLLVGFFPGTSDQELLVVTNASPRIVHEPFTPSPDRACGLLRHYESNVAVIGGTFASRQDGFFGTAPIVESLASYGEGWLFALIRK